MGDVQALAAAVRALVPTTVSIAGTAVGVDVHDTVVPSAHPARLYFVVNVRLPLTSDRSEAVSEHAALTRVAVTIGARTGVAVRDMAAAALDALDQAVPVAAGWHVGRLLLVNTRGPDEDRDVTFTDGTRVVYGLLEFTLTASRA